MVNSRNKWRDRIFRYVPLFVWIVVILGLGSGMGASNETSRFIKPLLEFLFPGASPETLTIYHGYIRKLAHPTVYGILALLAVRAFFTSKNDILRRSFASTAMLLVIIVASIDEFNQGFLQTRTGSIWDVLLDSAGGAIAILIARFCLRRRSTAEKGRSLEPLDS